MILNAFLFIIIIYIAGETTGRDVPIPPCGEWAQYRTTIIGSINGVSGSNNSLLNLPTAVVAIDQNDALYVVDSGNNRLMKYEYGSSVGTRVAIKTDPTDGTLNNPQDIAIDQKGRIYISEAGANRVLRWTLDPPKSEVLLEVKFPGRIYLDEDNDNLYIVTDADYDSRIIRYDLKSSKEETLFHIFSNSIVPAGIHVDSTGTVFIAESGRHRIVRWSPKRRTIEKVAGTGEPGSLSSYLNYPSSVILNEAGMMYVADTFNDRISYWAQNATRSSCFLNCTKSPPLVSRPYAITFDSKMNFLVVEKRYHRILRYNIYYDLECVRRNCRSPGLSIRPHPRSHDRSDSMTIFVDAKINCGPWGGTTMKSTAVVCYQGDRSCSRSSRLDSLVTSFRVPKSYNLRIPPFGLPVGLYNFSVQVIMDMTGHNSTVVTTLRITRSQTAVLLLPLGVSKILLGYNEQYTFSPKISKDDMMFENMKFVYYCRKYPQYNYRIINGTRQNIDQDGHNPTNSTCFNLKAKPKSFIYDNDNNRSSMTIMSRSLQINQTYEFYVEMYDNTKIIERSDVVLIEIRSEDSSPIQIASVFDTLTLDNDYQLFNPTTQLFLRSFYDDSYADASIQWRVYFGVMNASSIIEWEEYLHIHNYSNQWFYGVNLPMFTVISDFFSMYRNVSYWQLAVTYTVEKKTAFGAVQLKMNHPPAKGNCSASPTIGFTNGLFTIICKGWTDFDGIKDYFLHVISSSSQIIMSIAHSINPVFSVHLPMGDRNEYFYVRLMVHVRDGLGATTKSDVIWIRVRPDQYFINKTLNFTDDLPINGEMNEVVTSYSSILNRQAFDDESALIEGGQVKVSDFLVSTFDSLRANGSFGENMSAAITFMKNLNRRAIIREYLLNFFSNASIPTDIEQMIILSSTINQLTNTRSEWTREALSITATICHQLAQVLYNVSLDVTIEDVTLVANSLAQCTSNVFTGINGPLQHRSVVFSQNLEEEFFYSDQKSEEEMIDYELEDVEIPFCNYSRLKRNQVCQEIILNDQNISTTIYHKDYHQYLQKRLAIELRPAIDDTTFLIAKSIRHHLNILQDVFIKFPVLRMSVERIQKKDIELKQIDLQTYNATINLPDNLTFTRSDQYGIRATLLPLAPEGGDANVTLSTALTFSVLGDDDQEVEINATDELPIEMIIPRDVNLPIPAFIHQNMTDAIAPKYGSVKYNRQYFTYYINITQMNPNLTVSVHLDLQPTSNDTSYAIISALGRVPAYNSTHNSMDDWAMLCARNQTDEMDYYRYYIDNYKTAGFESLYLGIRELKGREECNDGVLPVVTDEPYSFSSNFSVRLYTSGCYYLDQRGYWKSDGMKVGKKTNYEYTHCYSNHT